MKKYRIFLIIAIAFAVRIYNVGSPLIGIHSWRQADTASMARNYYENGFNFLYPQIDWGGNSNGYVETEFPIYSYLVALLAIPFGFSSILGRMLSILFSLVSIYYLYLLVKNIIDENTALWASLFFSILPLNIYFGRAFMIESGMLMSSVIGIYYFLMWIRKKRNTYYIISLLFISLACLLKIPALYLGLPILYLAWTEYGQKTFLQWKIWAFAFAVCIVVGLWYYHAHSILTKGGLTFGIWEYGIDKWGNWSLLFSYKFWNRIVFQSLAEKHLTWFGFPLFLIGLFLKRLNRMEMLFDYWLSAVFVYFLIVARGNLVHEYYQLPFVIPAAVFIAKVYARHFGGMRSVRWESLLLKFCLIGIIILGAWRYSSFIKLEKPETSDTYQLAMRIQEKIEDKALIIAYESGNPTLLYLAHRKGWCPSPDETDDIYIAGRKQMGATYIVGNQNRFTSPALKDKLAWLLSDKHNIVYDDGKSFIVKI